MALSPPANTDMATMQALERTEERLDAKIDAKVERSALRTRLWTFLMIASAQVASVAYLQNVLG